MKIPISSRKKDVKTLVLDIIKRNGLSVKFKTKLYNKGFNDQNVYYHQEYIYNVNNLMNMNINLNLSPFIQFTLSSDDNREDLIMTEVSRNKFIRKCNKFIGLIEAYDAEDLDLIQVDSIGTHIASCFRDISHVEISLNKKILKLDIILREEIGDVGIQLTIDKLYTVLSIYDFLDLIYKIKNINFLSVALSLITYFGSPNIGENSIDFRSNVNCQNNLELYGGCNTFNDFDDLKVNKQNINTNNNKIKW